MLNQFAALVIFGSLAISYASPIDVFTIAVNSPEVEDSAEERIFLLPILFPPTYRPLRPGTEWTGPIGFLNENRGPFIYINSNRILGTVLILDRFKLMHIIRVNPYRPPVLPSRPPVVQPPEEPVETPNENDGNNVEDTGNESNIETPNENNDATNEETNEGGNDNNDTTKVI